MPRRPRIALVGGLVHIIQRGNNRSACFFVGTTTGAEVWFNDGTGTLGNAQTLPDIGKADAGLGDLDGDGDLDGSR